MSADQPVSTVVAALEEATETDEVCLRDILSNFGSASFPSILLLAALLLVSPLSGVPLLSSAIGGLIFLVAVQGMIGRTYLWLPRRLMAWKLNTARSDKPLDRVLRFAEWLDRGTQARLAPLVSPPASRVLYAFCALSGICLPLLELLPFTSSMIGVAVALIATGLLARDGLIAVLGLVTLGLTSLIPAFAFSALFA
ncbi:exopolysaccharide biosynthesis protein [Aestuariivita sp.]|jgi:hypothetical protein|uniref:exopolysaccharide biosynthesis protein n=1 Tax=Aestuariivita sp. TaxID=1872407 RepID=UPI00216D333C|nr:exopolysaccharide biosynthesis protein [Aestuariivita sp.]MCE8007428.1 exopolysaccharide biosynthesis protein [Aestuariivita sp.]